MDTFHTTHKPTVPGTPVRRSGHNATLLTGLAALFAVVMIGIAAPRLAGHAHANADAHADALAEHAASAAALPAAPFAAHAPGVDTSVPDAAGVFIRRAHPVDTSVIQVPTF
jgi:hypothetical protein